MSVIVKDVSWSPLTEAELLGWKEVSTAIVSDELNRSATMDAGIKCVTQYSRFVGRTMTVQTMAADNLAIHHAMSMAIAGAVLVVDAGAYDRNAVWGSILHKAAEIQGLAAVVIDGCVRDVAELRVSGVPCFARGVVPAGPHKGWGGSINSPIQAGGRVIHPGDLLIGDDDGVVVIPSADEPGLLARCLARIEAEAVTIARLEAGETTARILGLAPLVDGK